MTIKPPIHLSYTTQQLSHTTQLLTKYPTGHFLTYHFPRCTELKHIQVCKKSHFSASVASKNLKFLYMWRNFRFLHIWNFSTWPIFLHLYIGDIGDKYKREVWGNVSVSESVSQLVRHNWFNQIIYNLASIHWRKALKHPWQKVQSLHATSLDLIWAQRAPRSSSRWPRRSKIACKWICSMQRELGEALLKVGWWVEAGRPAQREILQ